LDELATDAALWTNAGRLANRDRIVGAMAARLKERPASEWIARLDGAGVPNGVVKSVLESLSGVDCSPLTGVSPTVPGAVRYAPPKLDAHGERVRAARWNAFDEELFP
jgi:crotonobetainyl-CoA:carnitine CoA-transferase CaiB-like acyl-CoA transferase